MALKDDLANEVTAVFRSAWSQRDGNVVPADESLKLSNDAIKLTATVLYADLADSTHIVDSNLPTFAAEVYKTFLHCAAKIIRSEKGTITAYDGDRIMAVFLGDFKNTSAARTALKINYAVKNIVSPAMWTVYSHRNGETIKHVVGIDTSELYVARTGVRGANDLVWVGRAANYAAKLATLPEIYPTYITQEVYDVLHESTKTPNGLKMWEAARWNTFDNRLVYRSNWWWPID
jgi:class 3 adenylate cyclase